MSDDAEWGPWVEHDGFGKPNLGRCWIEVQAIAPGHPTITDQDWSDYYEPQAWDAAFCGKIDTDGQMWGLIIRYRVRRPRALRDLIALVEGLPAPAVTPTPKEEVPA